MGKFVVSCLLLAASAALLGSQTVQAKPFIKLNFFTLTTRAPTLASSSTYQSTSTFQIPDFITPKLRLLTSLLQSRGTFSGSYGFGYKQFNVVPAAAATATSTTTTSFDKTTQLVTDYVPEPTPAISVPTTTRRTTQAPVVVTTEAINTASISNDGPGVTVVPGKPVDLGSRGSFFTATKTFGNAGYNGNGGGIVNTDTVVDTGSIDSSGTVTGGGVLSGSINNGQPQLRAGLNGGTVGTFSGNAQLNGYVYKNPIVNEITNVAQAGYSYSASSA